MISMSICAMARCFKRWPSIPQSTLAVPLVMPNVPPIDTGMQAAALRARIEECAGHAFQPLMTIRLTPNTTPNTIREAQQQGVVAAKVYPQG